MEKERKIDGFNPQEFAKNLAMEANQVVPPEISDADKKFVVELVHKFCLLCGDALVKDEKYNLNAQQASLITQFIGEWTFHKSIDLIMGGIPMELREGVLQKVAFTVFEIAKQAISRNMPQDQVVTVIENQVRNCFKNALEDLKKKEKISDEILENTLKQSNIDKVEEEHLEQKLRGYLGEDLSDEKIYKLATLALFVKKKPKFISDIIILFFSETEAQVLSQYLKIPNLKDKIDKVIMIKAMYMICIDVFKYIAVCLIIILLASLVIKVIIKSAIIIFLIGKIVFKTISTFGISYLKSIDTITFMKYAIILLSSIFFIGFIALKIKRIKKIEELKNVRQRLKDLVNPDKMYKYLKTDILSLHVGSNLVAIANPDQDGRLLRMLAVMRHELAEKLGYITPVSRIMDSTTIEDNEYTILIRGNEVAKGIVYPSKLMVIAEQWEASGKKVPDNVIVSVDPTYETQTYWIDPQYIEKDSKIVAQDAADVIIAHLRAVWIKYADYILTETQIAKYINTAKETGFVSADILLEKLSYGDIRQVFANLIREKVSTKDIAFVFERLCDYARFSKEPDILSERLRVVLGRQICLQNCNKDKTLYALTLSSEYEKVVEDLSKNDEAKVMDLKSSTLQELIKITENTLIKAHQAVGVQPVILCSPRIRLPLYQMLERHIPTIVVISYSELITDIRVEAIDTIGEGY